MVRDCMEMICVSGGQNNKKMQKLFLLRLKQGRPAKEENLREVFLLLVIK